MAKRNRTIDLLPEIFRTDTNRQLFSATLDQVTQEPSLIRTQGYVGRRVGPGVNPSDYYVVEPNAVRTDYQLEPAVTFQKNNSKQTVDLITYPGMIDALDVQGGLVNRQDRLFESQYYAWDPMVDFDKFANYSQYYWLPGGPDSVDVSATVIPIVDDFTVTRTATSYDFSGVSGNNPTIYLARGGNYQFEVNQPGHRFWIQAAPGVDGRLPETPNISSRDVYGVIDNGREEGVVEFRVPVATAQNFYYNLDVIPSVDLATLDLKFSDVNNQPLAQFLAAHPTGIDGIQELNNRTIVFLNTILDAQEGGWQVITDEGTTDIELLSQRYSVWLITYVDRDGEIYLELESIRPIPELTKFSLLYGSEYNNVYYYKNASGLLERVPLLTAARTTLYYQDSTNPGVFGEIRLVDSSTTEILDVDDIVGAKTYISPNGVTFTNGLKVQFRGNVVPSSYQNQEFYVEGVGTGPGTNARVGFINGDAYFGAFHYYNNQKMTGLVHDDTVFQAYIYDTIQDSLNNPAAGTPGTAGLPTEPVPGSYTENGIRLIPVQSMITPETYTKSALNPYDSTPFDTTEYDASLNAPLIPDYITQNRSSADRNAWSRSNRWFHVDVINYSAQRNGLTPTLDNELRAKRPIVEFRGNLRLWNNGTQAKSPVNIIDFVETDALSNINGTLGYGVDGYTFINGTRVIFAADIDPLVRNRVYEVQFIDPTGTGIKVIDLVPTQDTMPALLETVVSLNGNTQQGITFWFNGVTWTRAQLKTRVNQPPLFDVYDSQGRSFGDRVVYPSSTFEGSRLFGYAESGSTIVDPVLGFGLRYLNIQNVGDILFENYFYTDNFIYVENRTSSEVAVSSGFARQYVDRTSFTDQIGWQTAATVSRSRQTLRFIYQGQPLVLGIPVRLESILPPVQIFVEGIFIDPTRYTVTTSSTNTEISLDSQVEIGAVVEVQVISDVSSDVGFYAVPDNLEANPLNENSSQFTLGTIRTHYESIAQNLRDLTGVINGANNTRDLGNIVPYGTAIIQNSSPLTLAGTFMRKERFDIFSSLSFNSQEYEKYKTLLMDLAARGDFVNLTPTQILDSVLTEISIGKTDTFPFYWSDMVPNGGSYIENNYTISFIDTGTFDTVYTYDFTSSNYKGLLVYFNGEILTLNYDYTVPENSATVVLTRPFSVGDVVTIREYATTYGSFVPNTPTKMGLYPAWRPELYLNEDLSSPTLCIRGHDGSLTVAYGDFRDQVLLEFELRIFNNLKIRSEIPMVEADVIPGQFRTTQYSLTEINEILLPDFLNWVGKNQLNYTRQTYQANNAFTYNYSQSSSRITGEPLLGGWRGIYLNFYDTVSPNTTPWEMLGFSQRPSWWDEIYSAGPYTSGNLVLWGDLERGFIADPENPRIDPRYVRPGLTRVIPADSEGGLIAPLEATVGNYDAESFRRSWAFGDGGPVESTWRCSSSWPFAVMRLLALTQPAKFFSLMVDRDRYVRNAALDQYVWDERYRLNATAITPIYGSGVSKASYINWIVDYNQRTGAQSSSELVEILQNIDVRLCWRLGGFSDKNYLKIYSERSTPSGANNSLLLPDESYQLMLYRNQPFGQFEYSSVIVRRTQDGYAVSGYNSTRNYFEIFASRALGLSEVLSAGGSTVRVPTEYTDNIVRVPYGFVFSNREAVCDFLLSYGRLLTQRGLTVSTQENGYIMDWRQMAQEFLYWSNQGWSEGSIINLNPGAVEITVSREDSVVDSLYPSRAETQILNQNQQGIKPTAVNITRLDNTFRVNTLTSDTINLLRVKFVSYEHVMVLDNRSVFGDLLYDNITGARQSRLLVSGWISGDWNGTVNAPGFVLNQGNIAEWQPNIKYSKGDIVLFKNEYWSASTIVAPAAEFNYADWLKSDYQDVKIGLLPNAATVSDQLARSYSINDANLENEVSLFSYGLIGFRPRQYMQALNLDDESQVNLYSQFLGSKGTRPSAEIFTFADIGKEIALYDIYEYWAILKGAYGATANRKYIELQLNEALLPSDPATISVVQPQEATQANQPILLDNVWKSSYKLTSTDIFPTVIQTSPKTLPTAGYVDIEDVDITVFDLTQSNELDSNLDTIGIGTTIWAAKVDTYNWNVYRVSKIPGQVVSVQDNLDGSSLVTFEKPHGLVVGQNIIIKEFNNNINGAYIVLSTPSIDAVTIAYEFTGLDTLIVGNGLCFILQTSRVRQASDIVQLPYADQLGPGVQVWVDDDGTGHWEVVEKSEPFLPDADVLPRDPVTLSRYGASVSQGLFNLTALVGAPGYNVNGTGAAPGGVYAYVRTDQNVYEQGAIITSSAVDTLGLGNAVDVGSQNWSVIGASASLGGMGYVLTVFSRTSSDVFDVRQVLLPPDQDFGPHGFGHAVTMSQNERWMYVSSPAVNRVYAYAQHEVQTQRVEYITDGVADTYNYSNNIVIDYSKPEQLSVALNNVSLTYNVDYTVDADNIILTQVPTVNRLLVISRRQSVQLDQTNNTSVAGTGGSGSGALFDVNNVRGVYTVNLSAAGENYQVGDVLTLDQDDIATQDAVPPSPIVTAYVTNVGASITVSSTAGLVEGMVIQGTGFDSGQYIESIPTGFTVVLNAAPDSTPSGNLTFSYDAKVVVTAVDGNGSITAYTATGVGVPSTVAFELDRYLTTATNIYSFTVRVNNVIQRPYIDYDFNSDSSLDAYQLVFNTVPDRGAVILVSSETYYEFVHTIEHAGSLPGDRFGETVSCTSDGGMVIVGAPNVDGQRGRAYVFNRSTQRFQVTDPTATEFRTVQSLLTPGAVAVKLNGEYLISTLDNIGGTYTLDTTNPGDPFVEILVTLDIGDIVEIETNQITPVEVLQSHVPLEEAAYGFKLDQCVNDCSLYVSAPYDSSVLTRAGKVEFLQNQARVYGVITSTIANPTLSSGDYIRINNYFVESTGTTVADLVEDINAASIPNVVAVTTPDIVYDGDGVTRVFDVGSIYSAAASYTTRVLVDDVVMVPGTQYAYDNDTQQITFTVAPAERTTITVVSGRVTISVKNIEASVPLSRLSVLPGTGTVYDDAGFDAYIWQQTITSPVPQIEAEFGKGLFISENTTTLMVGAPNGSMIRPTTFDGGTTVFDLRSTQFADATDQSGAVYSFDALPSANASATNPLQFVFGQQFTSSSVSSLDRFGEAIDYTTGILLIGAPGSDLGDSSLADFGKVLQFANPTQSPAWSVRRRQQPEVDLDRMNSIFLYDLSTNAATQYLDYFNPLQGKMLGVVDQNIDFVGAVDPAAYNNGSTNNYGSRWAKESVGKIWWDVSNVRFINPGQNDINYASRRWGQTFPGSMIDVYQWTANSVPPDAYTGPGTVYDIGSYTVTSTIDDQGFLVTNYYYWIKDINTVDSTAGKTLGVSTIARYIEDPLGSGIPYVALLSSNSLALYNSLQYVVAENTVLHVEFDQIPNSDAVHEEYQLIGQDRPDSFLGPTLYRKFIDSLSGSTVTGAPVPDPLLPPSEKYGVAFNPRQSMFVDRFLALENYITEANRILAQYPITEMRTLNILNSAEPEPSQSSDAWDQRVANIEELSYQDLYEVPLGYRYLVATDSNNDGYWTIYTVTTASVLDSTRILVLSRVQNYDTRRYWSRVDWYRPGYNSALRVAAEVPNVASLDTLDVVNGTSAKVTSNSQGRWEIYLFENNAWSRVGLELGTIQLSSTLYNYNLGRFGFDAEVFDSQYYDQAPLTETRKVVEAINQELFVDELGEFRNRLLVLMFNYILDEQIAPRWLTKTSLIDVTHTIRELLPYQVYRADNQDFVLDYINEVKPYHVQIREFNLKYQGLDVFRGDITDFDLPAYYNSANRRFVSPVLDNTGTLSTTSSVPSTSSVWQTFPYNQWYQNYTLGIDSVIIIDGGSGYISPPEITITGDAVREAVMVARINSAGKVIEIIVVDPGTGYVTTPTISFTSTGGSGAKAVAVMGNNLVRNISTTIKYDRYQYSSPIPYWQSGVFYVNGEQVMYADRVWAANGAPAAGVQSAEFDPTYWVQVPAGDLSGVERTMGYYQPTPNMPGKDLALLISGVDYPGVQVMAPTFSQNTGFDVGNFDINPFDNISFGPEGRPTYDPAILDAIYESSFADTYLGTRPTDINVDGGAFVDTFESHAPEELVPGITYDTLDFRVYTSPGADWLHDGHGFDVGHVNFVYTGNPEQDIVYFGGIIDFPVGIAVYNLTQNIAYSAGFGIDISWPDYTASIPSGTSIGIGDTLVIKVFGVGGGNIGYIGTWPNGDILAINIAASVPYPYDDTTSLVVFKNGARLPSNQYIYRRQGQSKLGIIFNTPLTVNDRITVLAYGENVSGTTPAPSWSTPVTQSIVSAGQQTYTLVNDISGTNPANLMVIKNGVLARPPEGVLYVSDGSTVTYELPNRGGYDLALVSDNDVSVYIANIPQILGVDFVVDLSVSASFRTITLTSVPDIGKEILISVRTRAQYWIVGNQLILQASQGLVASTGDIIQVTTFNDTSEQSLLTQVFVGPETTGLVVSEGYDDTLYDQGNITGSSGSFDYQLGTQVKVNSFDIGRAVNDPERLWVSLDGRYLFPNEEYVVDGTVVKLVIPTINASERVVITSMTNHVVPPAIAFRIFQDMRGSQYTYRMTPESTTFLSQDCSATDDILYLVDASKLTEPDLANGVFGLITIDGEKIAYRERNVVNNTVSGLRRGVSGTAAASHLVQSYVYDIGLGNLLPVRYQDRDLLTNFLANGTQTSFVADYSIDSADSADYGDAVLVYVGGILQTSGYTVTHVDPVQVVFDEPPTAGYQVSIRVRSGLSWYQPGANTASDGVPLQDTDTQAARFFRGDS